MKRKLIGLSVVIVLAAIVIYLIPYFKLYRLAQVQNISYENGLSTFFKKIEQVNPTLQHTSYYYFSAWNTRCAPCIEEMPRLDSLADSLSKKIACIYVSDDPDEKVQAFLKRKNISSRNFTYLNDMDDFISAVYTTQKIKTKIFPTHFITDSVGNILIFKQGSLAYGKFSDGHIVSEADKKFMEHVQDPFVSFLKKIH